MATAKKVAPPNTKWKWLNLITTKTGATPYMLNGMYTIGLGAKKYAADPLPAAKPQPRIWFSNPRATTDTTWEVLTIKMRQAVTVTDLSFSLFNVGQKFTVYATSSTGVTSPLIGADLKAIAGTVAGIDPVAGSSAPAAWVSKSFSVRATNIVSLEIRVSRTKNTKTPSKLVSLGIRDILIKRKVTTQNDTLFALTDQVDSMGNAVRHAVTDWNPYLAADSDAYTFWRSGPQPDPNAVVNYYANIADNGVGSRRVDRFWLDPVYTGNTLNVYYSNDDTIGVYRPAPYKDKSTLTAPAKIEPVNGIRLTSGGSYKIKTSKLISSDGLMSGYGAFSMYGWLGVEWDPADGLSGTTNIYKRDPFSADFILSYNNTTKIFTFQAGIPGETVSSSAVTVSHGTPVQITTAVQPRADGATGYKLQLIVAIAGTVASNTTSENFSTTGASGLTNLWSVAGTNLKFDGVIGDIRNVIIKGDPQTENDYLIFVNDPSSMLSQASYSADDAGIQTQGRTQNGNLDYALFVGHFTTGNDGYGGIDDGHYAEKIWTPVWKDWTAQRGFYYLPNPVTAKYLKFEFSKLTEQPYLVWENGIQVPYKKFPANILQSSKVHTNAEVSVSATSQSGALQRNMFAGTNDTATTTQQLTRQNATKTQIFVTSQLVTNLRNQLVYNSAIFKNESAGATSLRSSAINDIRDLSSGVLQSMIADNSPANDKLAHTSNQALYDSATGGTTPTDLNDSTYTTALAARVPGWWILPGGNLKIPSNVMDQMTKSSTVTERPISNSKINTTRVRFPTSMVHRYEMATAYRDVGLAYFAGIRELQVFSVDYTIPTDADAYVVTSFDSTVVASSTNIQNGTSDLPMVPTSVGGTAFTSTWPSVGTYQKISVSTVDRGWRSVSRGLPLVPDGLTGGPQSFWGDTVATWGDTVNVWGSATALVGLDFESNIYFAGKQAVKIARQAGSGSAGASTAKFTLKANTRIRLRADIFRPTKVAGNTLIIQLEDTTPTTGSVLKSFTFDVDVNKWVQYATDWFTIGADCTNLQVNLLINGTAAETLYVGDLFEEVTTIVYYASNDNGANYYEVTEIIGQENSFFVFPTRDNRLKTKIVMYDLNDYTYGMTIVPVYLF